MWSREFVAVGNAIMSPEQLRMPPSLYHLLRWGGVGLVLVGFAFVFVRLHSYWQELDLSRIDSSSWIGIGALSVSYSIASLLPTLAWWHLLSQLNVKTTHIKAVKIYGMSQLAKYTPGNIFHLAGRQALGMAAGMPAGALAKSIVWEHGSVAVAGALFGWLALPCLIPTFPEYVGLLLWLVSVFLVSGLLWNVVGRHSALTFGWQIIFLIISGSIFVALLNVVVGESGIDSVHWPIIAGAYIVAWLVGMVTPGAPAGVGVRELMLLLLLKGQVAEADLLLAVLLGRLVTVVGDILFFVATVFLPTKYASTQSGHV